MTRRHSDSGARFVTLVLSTTVATYLLIALGTAVSTTGSGDSCTTWPSCGGDWVVGPVAGSDLLFLGHRLAALLAGLLLIGTVLSAYGRDFGGRIRLALGAAAVIYPVQVGFGAWLVTTDSSLAGVGHLVLAMVIFVALLGALVWSLEAVFAGAESDDGSSVSVADVTATGPETKVDEAETASATTGAGTIDEPGSSTEESVDQGQASTFPSDGAGRLARLRMVAGAYLTLTKPKLMWLLCLVALAGMGLATTTGGVLELRTAIATLLGGVLAIGASGTFNHVYERDRDRRMERTGDRPLVHDLIPVTNAVGFGLVLTIASAAVMLAWVNPLATLLTLAAIGYYVVLYTIVLKPTTAWNTVLGGGAGALPALIGWVAVTGEVGLPAVLLAGIVFLWTPAHFYSLAIAYREDYARGGFPMFPVVEGVLRARRHVFWYLGATLLSASVLGWVAGLGWLYVVASVALGVAFLRSVVRQYRVPTSDVALRSFYVSNYYLGAILVAIVVETLVLAG